MVADIDKFDEGKYFSTLLQNDKDKSPAVASIETLYECLKRSNAGTVRELSEELKLAVVGMVKTDYSTVSISSATEIFLRFISLAYLDQKDFDEAKSVLLKRGVEFIKRVNRSRTLISSNSLSFIRNGAKILTHSFSKVVFEALKYAFENGRSDIKVFVTQAAPDNEGFVMHKRLTEIGIPTTLILDSAVGYVMEQIDFVLVGAEGVVENGGIINRIGTYGMAALAKLASKPVYVMAEHFKFIQEYPLNQADIPLSFKYHSSVLNDETKDLAEVHPLVDYTAPDYIQLLFTDLGVLTPAAVSDELVKLYL